MAYKQIYIKEADVALFEEAERYGDSLSRVISEALKDFVEKKRKELDEEGYGEIEISVGTFPNQVEIKKFRGKKLATCKEFQFSQQFNHSNDELQELVKSGLVVGESPTEDENTITWSIFVTKKGKYVIWQEKVIEEGDGFDEIKQINVNNFWIIDAMPGKEEGYKLKFDTGVEVPELLFRRAYNAANIVKEEWLDL